MLAISRKNVIRELLQENKSVRISELAERLQVAQETIRRDLREMEQNGDLIRTHGGAYILEGVQNDIDISTRQVLEKNAKEIIAQKCDAVIQPGDYIFLDNSTTAWFIARRLCQRKLTVLTTSFEIANILSASATVQLYLVGGQFSQEARGVVGDSAIRNLENYYVDKAIISTRSVSMTSGMTDTNDNAAAIHRLVMEHAKKRYLAVDHSKLDRTSFCKVGPLEMLDGIIMDRAFSDEWVQCLKKNRVTTY